MTLAFATNLHVSGSVPIIAPSIKQRHHKSLSPHTTVQTRRVRSGDVTCQGWSATGGWSPDGLPFRTERRKNIPDDGVPFLPQTIEYAIQQAQDVTVNALSTGHKILRVELPMGRARNHWYLLSPVNAWYNEASILAFHYAEMFRGACISVVVASGPGVSHPVPWIAHIRSLDDPTPWEIPDADRAVATGAMAVREESMKDDECMGAFEDDLSELSSDTNDSGVVEGDGPVPRVTIFTGVTSKQQALLQTRVDEANETEDAIIIFCSFLDVPLSRPILDPIPKLCYMCRAFDKLAVFFDEPRSEWAIFVEIAVFEYEWVGNRSVSDTWYPIQENLERFAFAHGAVHKKGTAYLTSRFAGCEAGFWPFMTISCRDVLPLSGDLLDDEARTKSEKSKARKSRPFGFF